MRCVRELLMTSISMQAFWVLSYLEANELLIKHIQLSVKAGIISTSPLLLTAPVVRWSGQRQVLKRV